MTNTPQTADALGTAAQSGSTFIPPSLPTLYPADVARLIRRDLKATFPGQRFSVRLERYSMGSTVHVSWTGGPERDAVRAIAYAYVGIGFDGRTDSTTFRTVYADGVAHRAHTSLSLHRAAAPGAWAVQS